MDELTTVQLTANQARRLCEKIASQAENLRGLLLQLRDGKGWLALGYATWALCCKEEFGYSKQHANRLIKAEEISRQVEPMGSTTITERQARELAKVPEHKRQEALDWATEKADGKPLTARDIRQAANDYLEAEPDAAFSRAVDKIADAIGPEVKADILAGRCKLGKAAIIEAADLPPKKMSKAIERGELPTQNQVISDAMRFAGAAIAQLERIKDDDPERRAALDKVSKWIRDNE